MLPLQINIQSITMILQNDGEISEVQTFLKIIVFKDVSVIP